MSGESTNVRVMVRCRLFNTKELELSKSEDLRPVVRMRDKTCAIVQHSTDGNGMVQEKERQAFQFDECFWSMPMTQYPSAMPFADNKYVYDRSGKLGFEAAIDGYNVTIFAYGQTGSGKTFSMLGSAADPGISPRLVDDLFNNSREPGTKVTVDCSFFEIYNEKVRDLFKSKKIGEYDNMKVRRHPTKGVFVKGLVRKEVDTAAKAKALIAKGMNERAMAETDMNPFSSRSHAVFQLRVTQSNAIKRTTRSSVINLVDLAGSEKTDMSNAKGQTLVEANAINKSLLTLRQVIDVLIDNSKIKSPTAKKFAPYRDSVLTYVLSDSLGGNSKTMMLATISPHASNAEDTLGTLRYALKAKAIVCDAKVNEQQNEAMLLHMREHIAMLESQIKNGVVANASGDFSVAEEVEAQKEEMRKMETQLADAEQLKIEMETKVKEAENAKAELSIAVAAQKRDRFAAAFRNAFLIAGEKRKTAVQQFEFEALRAQKEQLAVENTMLRQELDRHQTVVVAEMKRQTEERIGELLRDLSQRDTLIGEQKRQLSKVHEECKCFKESDEARGRRIVKLEDLREELEKRVQRAQQEILSLSATVEREQAAKSHSQEAHDAQVAKLEEEVDNFRKRKDKYKMLHMESKAKFEATAPVMDALMADRSTFVHTIQAQQSIVDGQGVAVQRMYNERCESERKAKHLEVSVAAKEEKSQILSEALREYQNAATEMMYENHTLQRELNRARSHHHVGARRNHGDGLTDGSGSSPSRSPPRYRQATRASPSLGRNTSSPSPRHAAGTRSPRVSTHRQADPVVRKAHGTMSATMTH